MMLKRFLEIGIVRFDVVIAVRVHTLAELYSF
jgi:hypothetical protein